MSVTETEPMTPIIEHDPDLLVHLVRAAQADGSLPPGDDVLRAVAVIASTYAENLDAVRCGESEPYGGQG